MNGPGIEAYLMLSGALFAIGLYGVLSRKNVVAILLSVELMANAVNLNLVAFARLHGDLVGQAFTLFAIALTVAEVVVGLAIVILLSRNQKSIDAEQASALSG